MNENKKIIEKDNNDIQEKNLALLKPLIDKISSIDLSNDDLKVDNYIESLKDYAEKSENKDEYANSPLFIAEKFDDIEKDELDELIESVKRLLDSDKYSKIINDTLGRENLLNWDSFLYTFQGEPYCQECLFEAIEKYIDNLEKRLALYECHDVNCRKIWHSNE